jgi:hypothetical protein
VPTLCRAYRTVEEARAAIDRLLAAGRADDEIRVLSGSAPHDHAADPVGRFAGGASSEAPVGTFAGGERATADPKGSFAGDPALRRRGGFGDLDRDVIATYDGDVRHVRVASHGDLHGLLVDAGLDAETAHADVRALHDGRVVVLVRTDGSAEDALVALEAAST